MIDIINVTKHYKNLKVLSSINLTIHDHEIFGIIGQSGAGKSTLLKLINGLEKVDEGSITVNGVSLDNISKDDLRALRFETGVIFQNFNLLNHLSVYDNIGLPLKLQGKKDDQKILDLLKFINMEDKKDAYPSTLSGGQMQRVAIARALITNPKVLLCDEATSALDSISTQEIIQLLLKVNEEFSTTIIVVTHDLDVAKKLCNSVAILEQGHITDIITVNKSQTASISSFKDRAREVLEA